MRRHKLLFLLMISLLSSFSSMGQDPEFSQFYSAPMHLNPALAGISYGPRFSAIYRNQWPGLGSGISGGFVTYLASYDQHIESLSGGIGISILADQFSSGTMTKVNPTISYSFQARLAEKLGLKVALEGSFYHISIDWNELLLADASSTVSQFLGLVNFPTASYYVPPNNSTVNKFDLNTGLVIFSNKLFVGVAVKHLLRPDLSFYGAEEDKLDTRFGVHLGGVMYFGGSKSNKYFAPNAMFLAQGPFKQINAGILMNVNTIFAGVYFRHTVSNSDALILQMGVSKGVFRLGYSYDATISDLSKAYTRGTHELALTFNLAVSDNSLNPKKRSGILKCPALIGF